MDANPAATLTWLASNYGLTPQHLVQYWNSQQAQPQHHAAYNAALEQEINRVASTLEDFDNHGDDILEIVEAMNRNGKRSNNVINDLRSAYKEAVRRNSKLTPDQRTHKQMSRTYDRLNPK